MNKYFAIYVYVLCVVHYLCCSIWWCKKHKAKNVEVFYIKLMDKNICMHTALKCIFLHGDFYKPI